MKAESNEIIGAGKAKFGDVTGDQGLQADGRNQKVKGKVQKAINQIKGKVKDMPSHGS